MTIPLLARVIRPHELPKAPWTNGAGYTREISRGSLNAPGPRNRWRLSLADLTGTAVFSVLPGIDRVFTLASAGPLSMTVNGKERTLRLGQKAAFDGEAAVATVLTTPEGQLGLNLMTHRGACRGSMSILQRDGKVALDPGIGVVAATILAGTAELPDGQQLADLATVALGAETVELEAKSCLIAIATVRKVLCDL